MKRIGILSFASAFLLLISAPIYAQDNGGRFNLADNLYGAISFGESEYDIDVTGITDSDLKDSSLGFSLGYSMNENFGLEVGYHQFGEGEITVATGDVTFETAGFKLGGSLTMPVSDNFVVGFGAGFLLWDVDMEIGTDSDSADGSDAYWGLMFGYDIDDRTTLGLGYSTYSIGGVEGPADSAVTDVDGDISDLNAFFVFRF